MNGKDTLIDFGILLLSCAGALFVIWLIGVERLGNYAWILELAVIAVIYLPVIAIRYRV